MTRTMERRRRRRRRRGEGRAVDIFGATLEG
jgi:hypothetical protein